MRAVPRWGFVQAEPHEHLLHLRDGRVLRSVQGGGCWRWPGDTVALVDTRVRRLRFTADQITLEKVGVAVTGLAVWRVVEPSIAWRMLDLEDPNATSEILREMLMGATRRLVANLRLQDCLTRRKDAIAAELVAELAPVVSGSGRPEDGTDRGWGIALDTIEVQDVRVLSVEVFERLQADYRESLALSALQARAEVERAEAALAAETERREEDRRRELMAQQEARLTAERSRDRDEAEHKAELARAEEDRALARRARLVERELREAEQKAEARRAARKAEVEAEAELARLTAEEEILRAEQKAISALRVAEQESSATRLRGEAEAEVIRLKRAAEAEGHEAHLQALLATETLPRIAEALNGAVEQQVVLSTGEHDVLGRGLAQVLGSLRAFGVQLPGMGA